MDLERIHDAAKPCEDPRHEAVARYMCDVPKWRLKAMAAAIGIKESTAAKISKLPQVVDRVTFIQRSRVKGLVPLALSTLEKLLSSGSDGVRLKAAITILDRAGFGAAPTPQVQAPRFEVRLDLGGPSKTAPPSGPPHPNGEFFPDNSRTLEHLDGEFFPVPEADSSPTAACSAEPHPRMREGKGPPERDRN